jgi:hypothetical protein
MEKEKAREPLIYSAAAKHAASERKNAGQGASPRHLVPRFMLTVFQKKQYHTEKGIAFFVDKW